MASRKSNPGDPANTSSPGTPEVTASARSLNRFRVLLVPVFAKGRVFLRRYKIYLKVGPRFGVSRVELDLRDNVLKSSGGGCGLFIVFLFYY